MLCFTLLYLEHHSHECVCLEYSERDGDHVLVEEGRDEEDDGRGQHFVALEVAQARLVKVTHTPENNTERILRITLTCMLQICRFFSPSFGGRMASAFSLVKSRSLYLVIGPM